MRCSPSTLSTGINANMTAFELSLFGMDSEQISQYCTSTFLRKTGLEIRREKNCFGIEGHAEKSLAFGHRLSEQRERNMYTRQIVSQPYIH